MPKIRSLTRARMSPLFRQLEEYVHESSLFGQTPLELSVETSELAEAKLATKRNEKPRKGPNEDRFGVCDITANTPLALANRLHEAISALNAAYKEQWLAKQGAQNCSGSTLVGCVRVENQILSVNVGDSRAAFVETRGQACFLTRVTLEHNFFHSVEEHNRVVLAGGNFQLWQGDEVIAEHGSLVDCFQYQKIVSLCQEHTSKPDVESIPRLNGVLECSRALGDFEPELGHGISAVPTFSLLNIRDKNGYVVIASDALWDALSDFEIEVVIEKNQPDPARIASALAEAAKGKHIRDDITIMVVPVAQMKPGRLYFVLDGHNGEKMAEYARVNLSEHVKCELSPTPHYQEDDPRLNEIYALVDEINELILNKVHALLLKFKRQTHTEEDVDEQINLLKLAPLLTLILKLETHLELNEADNVADCVRKIRSDEVQAACKGCNLVAQVEALLEKVALFQSCFVSPVSSAACSHFGAAAASARALQATHDADQTSASPSRHA